VTLIAAWVLSRRAIASRMPTSFQEQARQRLPNLAQVSSAIKRVLDPDGVIAPGKYGIV